MSRDPVSLAELSGNFLNRLMDRDRDAKLRAASDEWAEREKLRALREAAEAEKRQAHERARAFAESGIPARAFQHANSQVVTEATRAMDAFDKRGDDCEILVLSGGPGVGKTVAAARWCWNGGKPGLFLSAVRFVLWPTYDNQQMERLFKVPRLVLDDLGKEYGDKSGNSMAKLFAVLNERYDSMLATVVTTNLTSADFRKRYGSQVCDRLKETGRFVEISGNSMRTKEKKA